MRKPELAKVSGLMNSVFLEMIGADPEQGAIIRKAEINREFDIIAIIDQSPFPRMVDMWFLAICIAARHGSQPADLAKYETRKIIEGSILSSDPWRVHTLMLIAIAQTGDIEILSEPRRMMAIANGPAVAVLPKVLDMLKEGGGDAIWNLSEAVEKIVTPKRTH